MVVVIRFQYNEKESRYLYCFEIKLDLIYILTDTFSWMNCS